MGRSSVVGDGTWRRGERFRSGVAIVAAPLAGTAASVLSARLLTLVLAEAATLGALAASGKIPPLVSTLFRALLSF